MLQNAIPLKQSAPWPPNMSDGDVPCTVPATRNASLQTFFKCPTRCHRFQKPTNPYVWVTFHEVQNPLRLPSKRERLNVQKWSEHVAFYHSDLETRFAPQGRALFQHLNFQKCSDNGVLCALWLFWLRTVRRATTPCTFSTSQLPKGLTPPVFYTFHFDMCFAPQWRAFFRHLNFQKCSKPAEFLVFWLASCHKRLHFFHIGTSKSAPTMRCFDHFDFEICVVPQWRAIFDLSPDQMALHPPL